MHCKKVSYFFKNWGNLLGKVTYLKIKGNFYLSQKPVRYCMLPAQNQNVFTPFARTPLRVTSEHLGSFFLLPKGMLGDISLLPTKMNYSNIDTPSLQCECSRIICPNVQNFCRNNGQFSSVWDATTSPASPCRTLILMSSNVQSVDLFMRCTAWRFWMIWDSRMAA